MKSRLTSSQPQSTPTRNVTEFLFCMPASMDNLFPRAVTGLWPLAGLPISSAQAEGHKGKEGQREGRGGGSV